MILSITCLLVACHAVETDEDGALLPRTVALSKTKPADGYASHIFVGSVQSSERARLAFAQAGSIGITNVEIGDHVNQGTQLATLEVQPFERRREQARAGLDRARAAFNEVEKRHAAQKSLVERGFFRRLTFESTVAQLEVARADVRTAEAELALSERTIREARIVSPISGTVAQRMAEPGEFVQPGQTIFEIDGDGSLEAIIPVPAAMAAKLSQGVDVILESAGEKIEGKVLHIGERQGRGGLVTIEVLIGEQADGFHPGATVEARFILSQQQGEIVEIPLSAFLPGAAPNRGTVFAFNSDTRRVKQLDVAVRPADGETLLTSSLAPGMLVVSAGVRFLNDGDLVNALPVTAD
ncbi:hypothetical protein GCM10009096_21440 [Parasphingorhabdus litoris]|uniref:Multidrug resistance protein MdtA-like barrel-sandwich hybrid domain-containing protein n=1 Tax=Parasphingorhabdus litoris TaxID=394733 RepID=A0ABN1ALK8_9SPHN|nr:efflux RND transporter periplasmic adaptor subunit [Parasphingorhabdus litoris]